MRTVAFVTTEIGKDLIVSFALVRDDYPVDHRFQKLCQNKSD